MLGEGRRVSAADSWCEGRGWNGGWRACLGEQREKAGNSGELAEDQRMLRCLKILK